MKKACLSLLAFGVLAFGIVFSPTSPNVLTAQGPGAEVQHLPIQPPV
jgi:hypothetical protein